MELYRIIKLEQPNEFKFKYPYVVYKYVKNGSKKPIYTAKRQFRTEENAIKYVEQQTEKSV